jgi:hypothetical protein
VIDAEATVRNFVADPELNEILWLVWHGVPFDVAFTLPPDERYAYAAIFGKFEGGKFNLETLEFEEGDK